MQKEFNRRTNSYKDYNFLQKRIAKELVSQISSKPKKILDLGAGDGEVYKNISWNVENFIGIEFAQNMRESHPKAPHIEVLDLDFNQKDFLKNLQQQDLIISSSSLQWSQDLEETLKNIKTKTENIAFAIFTDGTFKTLREVANIPTHLKPSDEIQRLIEKYFQCNSEVKHYTLEFQSKKELFTYIKKSGVSGGKQKLSFRETKDLINNYPTLSLEAEVIFSVSKTL